MNGFFRLHLPPITIKHRRNISSKVSSDHQGGKNLKDEDPSRERKSLFPYRYIYSKVIAENKDFRHLTELGPQRLKYRTHQEGGCYETPNAFSVDP